MIPIITKNDLITSLTQIKSVTPVTAILDLHSSAKFEQGQKYQAIIEARLSNGISRVLVADTILQMNLPEKFQPGNKLELAFISHEPTLKFLILDETPIEDKEKNATISTTGRFLGLLMHDTLKHVSANSIPPLTGSTPILNETPINSTELPGLLQKAIVQSGLFYESHQAQWINGENTLENLHQEPQSKLMLVANDMPTTRAVTSSLSTDMPINTQSIPLVMQQLNTLETGHLFWQGEVWKNQQIEWDIYEQSNGSKQNEPDSPAQWRTQIRLSMPTLGEITAKIALGPQGVYIKLDVSQFETASLLKDNELPLAIDMQSAGLNIQSIEVQYDERK